MKYTPGFFCDKRFYDLKKKYLYAILKQLYRFAIG